MAENPNINALLFEGFNKLEIILNSLKHSTQLTNLENNFYSSFNKNKLKIPDSANSIFINFDKIKTSINSILESLNNTIRDSILSNVDLNNEDIKQWEREFKSQFLFTNEILNSFQSSGLLLSNLIENSNTIENFQTNLDIRLEELNASTDLLISNLDKIDRTVKTILLLTHSIKYKYQDVLEELYIQRFKNESEILFNNFKTSSNKILTGLTHEMKKIRNDYNVLNAEIILTKSDLNKFEEKNNELKTEYSQFERRLQQLADTRADDIDNVLKVKLDELENTNKIKIDEIDKSYQNAKNNYKDFTKLVESAGSYVLTDNYDKKSNEEKLQYETYRTYTSRAIGAAIFCTIVILTIPLIEHWKQNPPVEINHYTILARLTISLMFFVLALYFSKQSAKHYECYQDNNRTYLQLAALEPFMTRMTKDEKKEIRKKLIPSYFNQGSEGKYASKGDEVGLPESFTAAFEKLIESVKEINISQNSKKPDGN